MFAKLAIGFTCLAVGYVAGVLSFAWVENRLEGFDQ